jgi:hypothetical protein
MQNIAASVDVLAKQLSVMDTKLDAITDKTTVMSKVMLVSTPSLVAAQVASLRKRLIDAMTNKLTVTVFTSSTLRAVAEASVQTMFVLLLFTIITMLNRF